MSAGCRSEEGCDSSFRFAWGPTPTRCTSRLCRSAWLDTTIRPVGTCWSPPASCISRLCRSAQIGVTIHFSLRLPQGLGSPKPRRRRPPYAGKLADSSPRHEDAFRSEEGFLEFQVATKPAESAACGNHPVRGHAAIATATHDVSNRPRRPRSSRQRRHISICRDTARWYPPDDGEHSNGELRQFHPER